MCYLRAYILLVCGATANRLAQPNDDNQFPQSAGNIQFQAIE